MNNKQEFNKEKVRIVFLGGVSEVTKNMFIYEYWRDGKIVDGIVVDCGIGFPEEGDELLTPNTDYLLKRKRSLRGVVLTHGHEDHTGALYKIVSSYREAPVYGTKLTLGLAKARLNEYRLSADFRTVKTNTVLNLGSFRIEFVHVTHSIPDAASLIIKTPIGSFFHTSDFKFDWTPVDNWPTQIGKIAKVGNEGVLCLLSDCLRSETPGVTPSEAMIEEQIENHLRKTKGKFIFTTQSSNISRIQQAVNTALKFKRKIVFLGRSMKEYSKAARSLGYLKFPKNLEISQDSLLGKMQANKLFLIVAGSQAQKDSALSRLANGKNKRIKIKTNDTIVFSADPIPGYEKQIYNLVDKITSLDVNVVYSQINDALHVSGHASRNDLMLMVNLTRPKYLIPIGGNPRHIHQYSLLAQKAGYAKDKILKPQEKDAVEFNSYKQAFLVKNAGN